MDDIKQLQEENTRLRAALAMSDRPCAYCSLPAKDWGKCQHGFPGCDRADDAMGCPHLAASLEVLNLKEEIERLRKMIKDVTSAQHTASAAHPSDRPVADTPASGLPSQDPSDLP